MDVRSDRAVRSPRVVDIIDDDASGGHVLGSIVVLVVLGSTVVLIALVSIVVVSIVVIGFIDGTAVDHDLDHGRDADHVGFDNSGLAHDRVRYRVDHGARPVIDDVDHDVRTRCR